MIPDIGDEYRASEDPDDDTPGMCVTFGANTRMPGESWDWSYQTGDNSYTGGAYGYPHWGVCYLYRDSDVNELAECAAGEILDVIAWEGNAYR